MTDDERMDRARRIREMREGTGGAQADDSTADPPADAEATGDDDLDDASPGGDADIDDETGEAERDEDANASDASYPDDSAPGDGPDAGSLRIPGAEMGDVEVDAADLAERAGLDLDEAEEEAPGGAAGPVGMAGAAAEAGVETAAETRVLEFDLGEERYCLDIDHVEEIVKRETVTRVPNTPDYVEGVVDLRGQITTILDPKVLLDIDAEGSQELIVVFDPEEFEDQGAIGWIVDDVNQVTPVLEDEVNDPPVDADHIHGVVDRDGEFVVWTDPDVAIENAAG